MRNLIIVLQLSIGNLIYSQSLNVKLGYTDNDRLLIMHADDLGAAHSENAASFEAMKNGIVNSGSIIVPSPWFAEVVSVYNKNPTLDLGIHLALTSEWQDYKWGPVAPIDQVKSIVNAQGYFHPSTDSLLKYAKLSEVEKELDSQIKKCLELGMDITHLDGHMGWYMLNADYLDLYIRLGKKYNLPILFNPQMKAMTQGSRELPSNAIDHIYGAPPTAYPDSMAHYYDNVLENLQPGISEIILHVAYDNAETQAICVNHPLWGASWRQNDYNYVMSAKAKMLLAKKNIKLVTYRQIRDKIIRTNNR